MKKMIYLFIILFIGIIIIFFYKIGFFDSSIIKVDNIYIKKPFLYRNLNDRIDIQLKEHDLIIISFFKYDNSYIANYSIRKVLNKEKYSLYKKLKNLKSLDCNVLKNKIELNNNDEIEKIEIYKYPYIIKFNEINKKREKNFLNQICNSPTLGVSKD
ncbi:hypothetical protein ACOJTA_06115 [Malaciobacter sp. WC5094]